MTTIINKGKIGLEDLFLADSPEYPSAEFSRTGQISTSTLHKIPNIFYSGAESFFDTDGTLADNSDNKSCTQKAIKTYVDAAVVSQVSDASYGSGWNNITTIAPSKNAVYDYLNTLGTAAFLAVGTSANQVVQLDSSAKLPAVDGSQLTNVSTGDMSYANSRSKVTTATRDLAADSGDVTYTGAGFTPTAVVAISFTTYGSTGFATSASDVGGVGATAGTANLIDQYISGGNYVRAVLKNFTTDGAILTWTKTGTPTGTANIYFLWIR
jgi:hypothetical protein